tara:strand:+ start:404 stop:1762 length:1359 start_codon:yes stop_codon:yes gene_type:complete
MFHRFTFILTTIILFNTVVPAWAADKPSLIRDTEVESTIRTYAAPLFNAAGLNTQAVEIYIVNDETRNAFVTNGQKIFINSGLILNADNVNQIIGIIAHETGHIAGGHLTHLSNALSRVSATSILSVILGGAATAATNKSNLGAAIIAGGQAVAQRSFLKYSRVQEAAADIAALRLLDQTGQSARGMLEFLKSLGEQELLSRAQQNPYVRSHPLTRDRIATIAHHVSKSPNSNKQTPAKLLDMHQRIKAKLHAFIKPMEQTLRVYKGGNKSIYNRYARAIVYFRQRNLNKALPILDTLITEEPSNAFFHELKGQILFENAKLKKSLASYMKAAKLLPESALVRRDLARVQIEMNDPNFLDRAIKNLNVSVTIEPRSAFNWHLLAIAHGRKGNIGQSSIALAEEALLKGKHEIATFHARRVQKLFSQGEREWMIAEDIRLAAKELSSTQRRNK